MAKFWRSRTLVVAACLGVALTSLLPTAAAADPPQNDTFQAPTWINSLPFEDSIDISAATAEIVDYGLCPSAKTVWYEFSGLIGSQVIIDTSGTSFDTDIAVFDASLPAPVGVSCRTTHNYTFSPAVSGRYKLRIGTRDPQLEGNLQLRVYAPGAITGRVINEDSEPVADVEAFIYSPEYGYYDWTWTDAEGRYSFSFIPRGSYRIIFWDYSEQYLYSWYKDAPTEEEADVIEVTGGLIQLDDQTLLRGASISGTVMYGDGALTNACVSAFDGNGVWTSAGYAYDGEYTVYGLTDGSYRLQVDENCSSIPYGYFASEWYENAGSLETATPITLQRGDDLRGIDFVVEAAPPPSNDDRENAIELGDLPFNIRQGVSRATTQESDPLVCGITGKTAWFSYTAEENEQLFLSNVSVGATIAVHKVEANGSLTHLGCAASSYWTTQRFSAAHGSQYLLEVGARTEGAAGVYANLFDSEGGGTLHFAPENPCHVQCPYWNRDRTVEEKNEDACAPQPASTEGSWEDERIDVPASIGGKTPYALGFTMDPSVDHDVWFCRVEADAQGGRYLVKYAANSPTASCDHGLPVGCTETFEAPVEPGKSYIIRVYNWSDPAPVDGTYWFLARAPASGHIVTPL